jgi:hypothetical protein
MSTIIQKLEKILENRAAESSSWRKHPRPTTPTNTEDFVNQNTLNNLSLNTPVQTSTTWIPTKHHNQSDTFYNQEDEDNPKQDALCSFEGLLLRRDNGRC